MTITKIRSLFSVHCFPFLTSTSTLTLIWGQLSLIYAVNSYAIISACFKTVSVANICMSGG
jgi:hypothetical protein